MKLMSGKKEITIIQHYITVVFGNIKLDYKTLVEFCGDQIDCISFNNCHEISIQTFTEAFFLKKILLKENLVEMPFIKIFLVNPDNLNAIPFYNPLECLRLLNQKNCDALLVKTDLLTGEICVEYIDVKTHGLLSVDYKHVSIVPENLKNVLKELNDFKISYLRILKTIKDEDHPIKRFGLY